MIGQSFDWTQYLRLAEELSARSEESCLRSSLSRAYYCVYNVALMRAEQNGFRREKGESAHSQLWRLFSESPVRECTDLGQIALRLRDKRQRADYEANYRRINEEVDQVLADARRFIEKLQNLPARHPNPNSVRR